MICTWRTTELWSYNQIQTPGTYDEINWTRNRFLSPTCDRDCLPSMPLSPQQFPPFKTHNSNRKFWEELNAYFLLIQHRQHWKRSLQQFFVAAGTSLQGWYLSTIGGYTHKPTDSPLVRNGPLRNWRVQQFCCCVHSLPRESVYRAVA
jgi:hypothetical protein